MEIVKALGNPELARNSLLDKERGAFSKVNAAKVLAARREQEGWMERVEEHRSPLLPFEYIYIFRFVSFEHCQMARRHRPRMSLSMRFTEFA